MLKTIIALILARITLLFWPEIIQFSLSRDQYYVCLFGQKLKIRGGGGC